MELTADMTLRCALQRRLSAADWPDWYLKLSERLLLSAISCVPAKAFCGTRDRSQALIDGADHGLRHTVDKTQSRRCSPVGWQLTVLNGP